jgi:hypothetical protein
MLAGTGTDYFSASPMSPNDILALLSFFLNILGTAATIFAAIFAYRSVKQFQSFCES